MRVPLLLLLLLVPVAAAQWSDDADDLGAGSDPVASWGFTESYGVLFGTHVSADPAPDGLRDLRLDDAVLLESIAWDRADGTWTRSGPLALLDAGDGAMTLHDNPDGWLTARADAATLTLEGTDAWTVAADGRSATSGAAVAHLDQDGALSADGATLTATFPGPAGLAVHRAATDGPAVHGHAPRAGAWAHVALGPDGSTSSDWLRVRAAPFSTEDWSDGVLSLDTVGTLGDGAPDLLLRIDLHDPLGAFAPDATGHPGLLPRLAGGHAVPASLDALLGDERGPFSYNATRIDRDGDAGWTLHVRLPAGQSGLLTLEQDLQAPTVAVTERDLDPWNPQEAVPTLVATLDEPGLVVLRVGDDYEKRTVQAAYEHRFRLVGLAPDTEHSYVLEATDLAGNTATVAGSFHAGEAVGGRTIVLTHQELPDGRHEFRANVTDETGLPVTAGVTAFLDKAPAAARYDPDAGAWTLVTALPSGTHEVAFEVLGPDGRTRETLTVEVEGADGAGGAGEGMPGPGPAALAGILGLALAAARRAPRPPQP